MNENELYWHVMEGVDVEAAAASFWASHPPSTIRHLVSQSLQQSRSRTPRLPCASSIIVASQHHPHVLASDRLLLCNYGAEHMPASEALLAQFAAAFTSSYSDKMLNNWLAGLQFWHIINGAPWHAAQLLHHTRQAFAKMVPSSSRWAKRPLVTIDALFILFNNLDLTLHLDAAMCAVAMIGFWCCCRLGELIIPSINLFDPLKHASRSAAPIESFTVSDAAQTRAMVFHILWTKMTKEQGADISITARNHRTCPLATIERHLLVNSDIPAHAPLFAYQTSTGWLPMMRLSFLSRCNEIWVAQGFPHLPGHAFCIGGTHPDVVATQGRWSSDAFLEYWRRIEMILPLFIASSANTQCLTDLDRVMDTFTRTHHLSHAAPSS
ncbi:hypothetical protein DFH29DRAFT_1039282 [Suillus ampliporus]|nr:hypothetical protein DFH29DRAFT_1039282 [Suillus ampliporus]